MFELQARFVIGHPTVCLRQLKLFGTSEGVAMFQELGKTICLCSHLGSGCIGAAGLLAAGLHNRWLRTWHVRFVKQAEERSTRWTTRDAFVYLAMLDAPGAHLMDVFVTNAFTDGSEHAHAAASIVPAMTSWFSRRVRGTRAVVVVTSVNTRTWNLPGNGDAVGGWITSLS